MDERNLKNIPCETKIEDSNRHSTSDPVENLEKLKVKTKNGLVNGVRDDKFKSNKKQSKTGVNKNAKETKKNKKDNGLGIQTNRLDALTMTNNDEKINNQTNCKSLENTRDETINSNCTKEQKNEISQTKTSQSNLKESNTCKKNKSKLNKSEQNELPKFDLTSVKAPWEPNAEVAAAGQKLFKANCALCHGEKGDLVGGLPNARNMVEGKWKYGEGMIAHYKVVQNGVPGTQMASLKASLKPYERWAILNYIETLTNNKSKDKAEDIAAFAAKAD